MVRIYIGKVEYRVSLLFPAALVVLLTLDNSDIPVWCVVASVMHEAGHFIAMYTCGCFPSSVSIGVFGVSATHRYTNFRYEAGALIALAGPTVNLISFIALLPFCGWSTLALVHFIIAIFNLLPIEALDGGQALLYLLAGKMGEQKAECICFIVSILTLIPLSTIGFFLLLRSGYNFTLIVVSIYLGLLLVLKRRH